MALSKQSAIRNFTVLKVPTWQRERLNVSNPNNYLGKDRDRNLAIYEVKEENLPLHGWGCGIRGS